MRPGPARAVQSLPEYVDIDSEPIQARDLLIKVVEGEEWFSGEEIVEKAEAWEGTFLDKLRTELSELNRLGKPPIFAFNSSSEDYLQGAAFIEPNDSASVRDIKSARARLRVYQNHIAHLSPKDFEHLCGCLLTLLQIPNPTVTSYSADEGIDFFGKLKMNALLASNDLFPGFQKQMEVWLIGQAKHYIHMKVSTPDIRELVGSVELSKTQSFGSVSDKYQELRIRACDPVFYLFMTTGEISSAGWRLCEKSGVVALNGEMIAAFLADHEIGIENGEYSDDRFTAWLTNKT